MTLSGYFNLSSKTEHELKGLFTQAFNQVSPSKKKMLSHEKQLTLLAAIKLMLAQKSSNKSTTQNLEYTL